MTEVLHYIREAKENEDAEFEISYEQAQIEESLEKGKQSSTVDTSRNLKDKRLFFEIRKDDLLNCCSEDQITVKRVPPTIPASILGDYKLPPVPESVRFNFLKWCSLT